MLGGRPRRRFLALAGALTVLAAGCASDAPQDTLKPKGPQAQTIHNLITPVFGVAAVVFVLILGGALFVAFKFRAKDDDDFHDFPEQVHGNTRLEIGWTILPAVILLFVGVATVATIFDLAKEPPKDAVRVEVIGQQWWWEYRYDLDGDKQYDDDRHRQRPRDPRRSSGVAAHHVARRHPLVLGAGAQRQEGRGPEPPEPAHHRGRRAG